MTTTNNDCEFLHWKDLPIKIRIEDQTMNLRMDFNQVERVENILNDYNQVFNANLFEISTDASAVIISIIDDDGDDHVLGNTTLHSTSSCKITNASMELECHSVNCGNARLLDVATHEIGHLLGSPHFPGTFMAAQYDRSDRRLPSEQILDEPFFSLIIDVYNLN